MFTLLYAGNLGLGHDLDTVVRALTHLNGQVNIRAVFVGEGKARLPLMNLTENLGLHNIKFQRPVPLYRLSDLLAEGDVHVVSQKLGTEGLIVPSKIYSVLAAARPTLFIGPNDCEPAVIVRESCSGIVVQPGDVHGTAEAIKQLASDPDLRREMGRRAREYYEEHFGRHKSVSRIIQVIESIT